MMRATLNPLKYANMSRSTLLPFQSNRRRSGLYDALIRCSSTLAQPVVSMEDIISLCKRRGFVFPGSLVYNGSEGSWDYGPLGAQLKKNVKDLWWRDFVERRADCVGLDSSIILNSEVWRAAGHLQEFGDYFVECRFCNHRFRVDKLLQGKLSSGDVALLAKNSPSELSSLLREVHPEDPCTTESGKCEFGEVRYFNGMFKTHVGATEQERVAYLRPETAQGIFVNFHNIQTSMRLRLPFGVGQLGKAFRNEVATGHFLFRTREFEQMELEFFCRPETSAKWHSYWTQFCHGWLISQCGIRSENMRLVAHERGELAHYSLATTDVQFHFPFGWDEVWGISNRGSFDLEQHHNASGHDLRYSGMGEEPEPFFPHTVEPAAGTDRVVLAILVDGYRTREGDPSRVVLALHEQLAPIQYAVLPLSKKDPLIKMANDVHARLLAHVRTVVDTSGGSIGKKYARNDEIGTPFCVTVDFDSLEDGTVTIRSRDSTHQVRLSIDQLISRCASGGSTASAKPVPS